MFPNGITNNLINYLESNIQIGDKPISECYKNRLAYGCGYTPEIEEILDEIHEICWDEVGPPWWVDLLE